MKASTRCKNVETLRRKTGLSHFKSQLFIHLWDIKLPPSLPFIQSRSPSIDELLFKAVLPSFKQVMVFCSLVARGSKGRRGKHKYVNTAPHFGPLGYFLESVDVREASLPLPTHHVTLHHIICFCCNIPSMS